MDLYIKSWAFWAPEPGEDNAIPSLSAVPPMMKRRLSKLTKLAFHSAMAVQPDTKLPCIFASRHGDLHKTLELLQHVAEKQSLSPTLFALSVHNAISGQYSIFSQNPADSNAIAAGADSLHYAIMEAGARLLTEPELQEILVVYADEPVPDVYRVYCNDPQTPVALALLLSNQSGDAISFCRTVHNTKTDEHNQALTLLPFLQQQSNQLTIYSDRQAWEWRRG